MDNCNEVSMVSASQIDINNVETTNDNDSTKISSTSASNENRVTITNVGASKTVTINQVITSSKDVVSYVNHNKKLPTSITVGSYSLTLAQFSYLVIYSIDRLNAGNSVSTSLTVPSYSASTTAGDNIEASANPVSYAKAILDYVRTYKILPGTVKIGTKKLQFNFYTYAFASALVSYSSKQKLPSTVLFSSSVYNGTPTPVPTLSVTVKQVMDVANTVKSYVASNKALPSTVTVGSTSVNIAQFSYLEAVAVQYLNAGKSTGTQISIVNVSSNSATYFINKNPAKSAYVSVARSVASSMSFSKVAPAYVAVSSVKADFRVYTYAFAKILVFYKSHNRLPSTCTFDSSVFLFSPGPIPENITYKKGVNELANETDLSKYLVLKDRCKDNNEITQLAKDLTKNCKSDFEKAIVIFEYVKKNIDYCFYYNSLYNATGILSKKKANCCDHSNLLVSIFRSAGLAARYSHAKCTFNSGLNVGHVWVQVYIKEEGQTGQWLCADATSLSNSIGYTNNWKLNSMTNLKQYNLLPF